MRVVCFCVLASLVCVGALKPPPYFEQYLDQQVDHFNYEDESTYKERYLVSEHFWQGSGPLFFYTGNEGPIEEFYDNSGFVYELAQDFKALIVFGEHRYYGKSLPFGGSTFDPKHMGYLSAEQALADFAVLIEHLNGVYNISKVISFGGSYGGMLSAWFRFKYPNVVYGALAASAPIYMVADLIPSNAFFELVTKDFDRVDPKCPMYVRDAYVQLHKLASEGQSGLKKITESFQLCQELTSDKVKHLDGWIKNSFASLAMVDYPYPASFLAPLPAYPVNVSCHFLLEEEDKMRGLAKAAGLFYNGTTGALTCYNITEEYVECADPTGCGTGPAALSWDFQACTEMRLPCSTNNVTDMFPPTVYDPSAYCMQKWGVKTRPGWMKAEYWGKDITSASNIIFSNGNLDPWSSGGVLHSLSDTLIAIVIEGGAHHLDLRASNPRDPPAVIKAREQEKSIIAGWLKS